jgi:RimJ/RimL family protein N-acetyltransferase
MPERFAICRLNPRDDVPGWASAGRLFSLTRTEAELSLVCEEDTVPPEVPAARGWRVLRVEGILDLALTGILSAISSTLAAANVALFALSTHDTDYILVKDEQSSTAVKALRSAGYTLVEPQGGSSGVAGGRQDRLHAHPPDVHLLPFERSDFARLIEWIPDEASLLQWAGTGFSFPLDEKQLETYLHSAQGESANRRIFKAVLAEEARVIGHIELTAIDRQHHTGRVARVLVGEPSLRRRGLGTQMVRGVVRSGFDELGLHRIELLVFDFNQPAIACYRTVGFRIEGHLRDALYSQGQFWNLVLMSILKPEWRRPEGQ